MRSSICSHGIRASMRSRNISRRVLRFLLLYSKSANVGWSINYLTEHSAILYATMPRLVQSIPSSTATWALINKAVLEFEEVVVTQYVVWPNGSITVPKETFIGLVLATCRNFFALPSLFSGISFTRRSSKRIPDFFQDFAPIRHCHTSLYLEIGMGQSVH